MAVDPQRLRSEPHPDVGLILARDGAAILERWSQLVRARGAGVDRRHEAALRDDLPHVLEAMAQQLASADSAAESHQGPAQCHGAIRWQEGWSIGEVVHDYLLLRIVILEHLERSLDRPLALQETLAVGQVLDEVVASSIAAYEESQARHLRGLIERQANELAARERRTDEFLATLGHELRNPLAALSSALELTRLADPSDPACRDAQEIMGRQLQQMTRLVDDLLDVSRIAQGKLELRRERTDMSRLAEAVAHSLQPVFDAHEHRFRLERPEQPVWLDADPARVQQVLTNALMNAVKFTPRGGHIELLVHRERQWAVICIRDDGQGIAEDLLPHVFELYRQAQGATSMAGAGLGIGLALMRHLVELHGGTVEVHSAGPGTGAQIVVRLPLAEQAAAAEPGTLETPAAGPSAFRRALVVEDEPALALMLAELVARCGVEVRVVHDASAALKVAAQFRPQIVLLDIGLPETSGYDVAAQVRGLPGCESTVFVALTGYAQAEDYERSKEAGFVRHLVKPVSFEVLQQVLADAHQHGC